MFTGIIKEVSPIEKNWKKAGSLFLAIKKPKNWRVKPGDSISTDGVCLTVKETGKDFFVAELMPETLKRSTFGKKVPSKVNLERPLTLQDFVGGHLILGHVDALGKIVKINNDFSAKKYFFSFPKKYSRFVVEKGSICVDGLSLTVVGCSPGRFSCSLVDYTLDNTTLGQKKVLDCVNIEFDILAKYLVN